MSNFTLGTLRTKKAATQDGGKIVTGTMVGPDSYDTGGSEVDLSGSFNGALGAVQVMCEGTTDYECQYVADTGRAAATGVVFVHAAGTEVTSEVDLSGVTFSIIAEGLD